jgi:hypothetical protein
MQGLAWSGETSRNDPRAPISPAHLSGRREALATFRRCPARLQTLYSFVMLRSCGKAFKARSRAYEEVTSATTVEAPSSLKEAPPA